MRIYKGELILLKNMSKFCSLNIKLKIDGPVTLDVFSDKDISKSTIYTLDVKSLNIEIKDGKVIYNNDLFLNYLKNYVPDLDTEYLNNFLWARKIFQNYVILTINGVAYDDREDFIIALINQALITYNAKAVNLTYFAGSKIYTCYCFETNLFVKEYVYFDEPYDRVKINLLKSNFKEFDKRVSGNGILSITPNFEVPSLQAYFNQLLHLSNKGKADITPEGGVFRVAIKE